MKLRIGLVAIVAVTGVIVSCGNGEQTAATAGAEAPAIRESATQTAYLISASGDARVYHATSDTDIEVGHQIGDGYRAVVADGSYADIQFGDRGLARIFGRAEVVVRTAAATFSIPVMELELLSGSVGARVEPLADNEVFRVRTSNAIYQVFGTAFAVSSGPDELVAVGGGEVVVYPPSLDLPAMYASLSETDAGLAAEIRGLESDGPRVRDGEQGRLQPVALDRAEILARQLAEKLRELETASNADRPNLIAELRTVIRETSGALGAIALTEAPITEDLEAKLAAIQDMPLVPVPKDPQNVSLVDAAEASELVRFTLRTVPQNADIFIGGEWVGSSVYRGILRANQSLSIRVTKQGYRERRIQIDRARSEVLTVQLERLPPSISAESFIKAISADDLGTIRTYVQEGGSVDVRTDEGIPAVVLASGLVPVLRGQAPDLTYHREIMRTIVAAGADLEAPFMIEGSTLRLLHAAVLAGVAGFDVVELMELLTSNNVNVDSTVILEGEELTPLAIAVRWALFTGETEEEIMKILLISGASLEVAINFNDELLTLREIAAQLLQQGEVDDAELIRLLHQAGVAS
jgi:hypothetical protein